MHTMSSPQYIISLFLVLAIGVLLLISCEENDMAKIPDLAPIFGKPMRDAFFSIANGSTQLNHGSFGAVPIPVQDFQHEMLREQNTNAETWFLRKLKPRLGSVKQALAKYLHCNSSDLALVENASTGVNTILRSLPFTSEDTIAYFSFEYSSTWTAVEHTCRKHGCKTVKMEVPFPMDESSSSFLLQLLEETIQKHHVTFAVFNHISSVPAVLLPLKELIQICRRHEILSLIDGAHAIGQLPVDLSDIDPDFWVSNGHKWLMSPSGSAVLYVKQELQERIHPLVISFTLGRGFSTEFEWMGTKDWIPALSMGAAIEFRESAGGEKAIYEHNRGLCEEAAELITSRWNTSLSVPLSMSATMINVKIPCDEHFRKNTNLYEMDTESSGSTNDTSSEECYRQTKQEVLDRLRDSHNLWTVLYEMEGVRYTRLSCHMYNFIQEYDIFMSAYEDVVTQAKMEEEVCSGQD